MASEAGKPAIPAMALAFAAGPPDRDAIARLGKADGPGLGFAVTGVIGDEICEIVAMGLAFDIRGLAGMSPASAPAGGALIGLQSAPAGPAITIEPAPNICSVPLMLPVVRVLAGVAIRIAGAGASGLNWSPARCWVEPGFLTRSVDGWLGGGAFPAPGLVDFARGTSGLRTVGLSAVTGQELDLDGFAGDPSAAAAIAVRLVHLLSESERIDRPREVALPGGQTVRLAPSPDGDTVMGRPA